MLTYINHVQCSGEELNLLDCSYSRNHTGNDHSKDVGVQCKKGELLNVLCVFSREIMNLIEGSERAI